MTIGGKEMSYKRKILVVFLMLTVVIACSKKEKKSETPLKTTQNATTPIKKKETEPQRIYTCAGFTDTINWINGVSVKNKSTVLLQIGKTEPIPFNVGYKLKFALTGEVEVLNVTRQEIKEHSNIFISLSSTLDPAGDGNPNLIIIKGFVLKPASANEEGVWRNGISLAHKGVFVFWIPKDTPIPIKTGDKLRFASSGVAIVKNISQFRETAIIVTVDINKFLDPDKDGFPNSIDVLLNE
jgi:hypothetical protein